QIAEGARGTDPQHPPEVVRSLMAFPVVFLPGVMGSRLQFTTANGLYWDPDSNVRMLSWVPKPPPFGRTAADLARLLHRDSPARVMDDANGLTVEQRHRGWSGVAKSFYVPFLRYLQNAGQGNVHVVGYDWRQDMLSLTPSLMQRLEAIRSEENSE